MGWLVKLDVKATKLARARHEAGVKRLNDLFLIDDRFLALIALGLQAKRPKRRRPGVPIDRSPRRKRRQRKRQAVRAARKANR